MKGDNHLLAVTTTTDEVTGEVKPLFAFPVQVCKATDDQKEVRFDIAAPSGAPRKQVYVDSATGEMIEDADCQRGVRLDETTFKAVPQEKIDQIEADTKVKTMVVKGKLPIDQFRAEYADRIEGRYFVQSPAKGGSATAYRLTYEALLQDGMALVTKRTPRTKQRECVIYADAANECLMLVEVAFAEKIREPDAQVKAPMTATVQQAQIDALRKVVGGLPDGAEALDTDEDEVYVARQKLIEQALAGEDLTPPTPVAETVEQDDLAAALEASLAAVMQ